MIAHLNAVKARIDALGFEVHIAHAATSSTKYVVLSAPGWGASDEMPVCGVSDVLDADLRVKAVTGTATGVLEMLNLIRADLSPGLRSAPLSVPGRVSSTKFTRSEFVAADTTTTTTATNRHPVQGVDTYRLVSHSI